MIRVTAAPACCAIGVSDVMTRSFPFCRHLMHGHLWSPSYFAASAVGAPLAIIKHYIEQQKRPA